MKFASIDEGHFHEGIWHEGIWPARKFDLLVLLSLAIFVSVLAFLCARHHVSRLEDKLHGEVGHRPVATEPNPDALEILVFDEGVP